MRVACAIACLSLVALAVIARAADTLTPERQREVVREALNAFDQAVAAARDDAKQAESLYQKAAAGFEALRAAGVDNAALQYNLGNTYFRLGRLGRSIAQYRRAARFAPTDAQILANLNYAREQVEPRIRPSGERALLERIAFWHYTIPLAGRYWISAVCSICGWAALIDWLRARWRPMATAGVLLVAVGLANAVSVAVQLRTESHTPAAVVVSDEATLRLGRGEGYDPALDQPLGPGVEVRIRNERGGWAEVELFDGQTGWLPLSALERV